MSEATAIEDLGTLKDALAEVRRRLKTTPTASDSADDLDGD